MAVDAFLWFPGAKPAVEGETTDEDMAKNKAIEIEAFSLGASNPMYIGSTTGGASQGKAEFSPVSIQKKTDKASMELFGRLCEGSHFPEAVIALRKSGTAGKSGETFLQFNLKMVFISGINWAGGSGMETCAESLTMDYGAIKIEYSAQGKDGKLTKAGEKMWSRIVNKATDKVA